MHLACTSLDEFFEVLDSEKSIFQSVLHVNISRNPVDGDRFRASKFAVVFQASAVVEVSETSQYILIFGYDCGNDYTDASAESPGTVAADAMKKQVQDYASKRGWRVLPGVVGF